MGSLSWLFARNESRTRMCEPFATSSRGTCVCDASRSAAVLLLQAYISGPLPETDDMNRASLAPIAAALVVSASAQMQPIAFTEFDLDNPDQPLPPGGSRRVH